MPHWFRITYKIEGQKPMQLFRVNSPDVDFVYLQYKKILKEKYGAGRIEYYDCSMISKHSFEGDPSEKDVILPDNFNGLGEPPDTHSSFKKKARKEAPENQMTMGERAALNKKDESETGFEPDKQ